jgi:hypothetical protein
LAEQTLSMTRNFGQFGRAILLQPSGSRRIISHRISEGFNPMNFRALIPSIALAALGLTVTTSVAPAAELAVAPAHRTAAAQGGLVLWDDVYPPAVYGPQLRPVEEVAAMKAQARPVSQRWWGYWYVR